MHVLIAEKNLNGRRMLNRILKMEGYEVSVADSGSHAISLLKEARPNVVLLNLFQCMHLSDTTPEGEISISHYDEDPMPVLLVSCSRSGESLAEFMSANNPYCDSAFDLLPVKVKGRMLDRIQQMCATLEQVSRFSSPEGGFNWQRFNMLMTMNTFNGNSLHARIRHTAGTLHFSF